MKRVIKQEYDSFVNEIEKVEKELLDVQYYKGTVAIYQGDAWHDNPIFRETEVREKHLIAKLRNMREKLMDMKIDVRDSSMIDLNKILYPNLVLKENAIITNSEEIKEKQDAIIMSLNNMLVSGVAGSRINMVLLHKIAYLLYQYQCDNSKVLLIDQDEFSKSYNTYMLSKFTQDNISQSTIINFLNFYINEKTTLEKTSPIKNKIEQYKSSMDYKESIDLFMKDYYEKYLVTEDFKIDNTVIYSKEYIKEMLLSNVNRQPNYGWALMKITTDIKENINDICDIVSKKYSDNYMQMSFDDPNRKKYVDKANEVKKQVKKDGVKLFKNYFKKISPRSTDVYTSFLNNFDKYNNRLSIDEVKKFKEDSLKLIEKKVVTIDDIPALLHINYLLNGPYDKNKKNEQYDYVIINNTHEFGMFHFYTIDEVFSNSKKCFFEDKILSNFINNEDNRYNNINDVLFNNKYELFDLRESYTSNNRIIDLANRIAKSNIETYSNQDENNIEYVDDENNDIFTKINSYGKTAIVCKDVKTAKDLFKKIKSNGLEIISEKSKYNGKNIIITPNLINGMEFDTIIMYNMLNNMSNDSKEELFNLYKTIISAESKLIIIDNQQIENIIDHNQNNKNYIIKKKLVNKN